ncbi:hypothetical protein B0H13DRAFT_1921861 [Mycena leptocephala]|nr:hypothetical protein B0H13DRAFT_1921861 [Mycena leptocephala]
MKKSRRFKPTPSCQSRPFFKLQALGTCKRVSAAHNYRWATLQPLFPEPVLQPVSSDLAFVVPLRRLRGSTPINCFLFRMLVYGYDGDPWPTSHYHHRKTTTFDFGDWDQLYENIPETFVTNGGLSAMQEHRAQHREQKYGSRKRNREIEDARRRGNDLRTRICHRTITELSTLYRTLPIRESLTQAGSKNIFATREGKGSHGNHKKSVTGEIREMGTTLTTNNDKFNDIMVKVIKIVG